MVPQATYRRNVKLDVKIVACRVMYRVFVGKGHAVSRGVSLQLSVGRDNWGREQCLAAVREEDPTDTGVPRAGRDAAAADSPSRGETVTTMGVAVMMVRRMPTLELGLMTIEARIETMVIAIMTVVVKGEFRSAMILHHVRIFTWGGEASECFLHTQ